MLLLEINDRTFGRFAKYYPLIIVCFFEMSGSTCELSDQLHVLVVYVLFPDLSMSNLDEIRLPTFLLVKAPSNNFWLQMSLKNRLVTIYIGS